MSSPLLIVESPSKCATIEKYLKSKKVKCIASFGHLQEIKSLNDIDIKNNFKVKYTPMASKMKQIDVLKKAIKGASEVILATDNDREGEAIAWHICQLFKLPIKTTKRIIFNEITEKALLHSFEHPTIVDMNIVDAQMARQVIDFIVGFKISPLLWKLASKSLSAGRCQSPALKIICDNNDEILNCVNSTKYNLVGYFTQLNIPFTLNKTFPQFDGDLETYFQEIEPIHKFNYSAKRITVAPPSPFSTSKLQQSASNMLNYSPKESMRLCQGLYEKGLITYMRTDSTKYSDEFIITASRFIENKFGDKFTRQYEKYSNNEETAHEAIRVTDVSKLNTVANEFNLEKKEETMYKFIWNNTIQSCMADAELDVLTAKIPTLYNYSYVYKCDKSIFLGWKIVEKKSKEESNLYDFFKNLSANSKINLNKIVTNISVENQILHFSEAKLVSTLEKKGIGRPSTFASIVDKIQDRKYVKKENIKGKQIKCTNYELDLNDRNGDIEEIETNLDVGNEKNKLVLNPLGQVVNNYLQEHFIELFNFEYTNEMENALDQIANNTLKWTDICKLCNDKIDKLIIEMKKNIQSDSLQFEYKFDDNHVFTFAKYGPVIKCIDTTKKKNNITFKKAKDDIDLDLLQQGKYSLEDVLFMKGEEDSTSGRINSNSKTLGVYNDKEVVVKKGKFGLYVSFGEKNISLKALGNRPVENITLGEIEPLLCKREANIVREINDNMTIRKGKGTDYVFYKTTKMKKPQFLSMKDFDHDYKVCDVKVIQEWLRSKYGVV